MGVAVMGRRHLGPVEFVAAPLIEGHPDPALLRRLSDLVDAGGLRVLDVVTAARTPAGTVSWSDVDAAEFALAGVELGLPGLVSEQDIHEVLARLAPGGWAIVLVERTWDFPRSPYRTPGATVVSVAHIPAAVAEAVIDDLTGGPDADGSGGDGDGPRGGKDPDPRAPPVGPPGGSGPPASGRSSAGGSSPY
jgi:hypothetical protein